MPCGFVPAPCGLGIGGCARTSNSLASESSDRSGSAERQPMKVSFRLDWYPVIEDGGEYQALVKNYGKEAGVDVSILPGGPGPYGIQEVAAGRLSFRWVRETP